MPRTADRERPEALLERIVAHLMHHGLADMSLRPLAHAVGSSPRVLLYYYGSKEKLVARVLAELRRRQKLAIDAIPTTDLATDCWAIWRQISAPSQLPAFRLFFEAFGIAMRKPRAHDTFLRATVDDWLDGVDASRTLATVVIAGLRGFMLDLCATGDRARVDRAVRAWTKALGGLR